LLISQFVTKTSGSFTARQLFSDL